MGFKVNAPDTKQRLNLWDAQAEALIALLAIRLEEIRGVDSKKSTHDLNFKYLRKRLLSNKKNYTATPFQRSLLEQRGY